MAAGSEEGQPEAGQLGCAELEELEELLPKAAARGGPRPAKLPYRAMFAAAACSAVALSCGYAYPRAGGTQDQVRLSKVADLFLLGRGQIHSAFLPGACLWVEKGEPGRLAELRSCNVRDWHTTFILPGVHGQIRFAAYPDLCLVNGEGDIPQLVECSIAGARGQWQLSDRVHGIRLAHSHSPKCLRAKAATGPMLQGDAKAGLVRVEPCNGTRVPTEMQWTTKPTVTPFGDPSVFCITIFMPGTYEHELLQSLLWDSAHEGGDIGIYGCDEFELLAKSDVSLGWHHNRGWVHSRVFKQAPVGKTTDGFAAMVNLMLNAWEVVHLDGVYKRHPWTLKTDPDAVVLADRLRDHLRPHTLPNADDLGPHFIRNCWLPGHPELNAPLWPMMHGPGEVMSRSAMDIFFDNFGLCKAIPHELLAEDVFMVACLNQLHVVSIDDWKLLSDDRCRDADYRLWDCSDHRYAIYHAFKGIPAWKRCWYQAWN